MSVEVYVWAVDTLRRVDVEVFEGQGILIDGVSGGRIRALRDRIYALSKQNGIELGALKVIVAPAIEAGSSEGVEVAALIAAGFNQPKGA